MATFEAITALTEAVVHMLRTSYDPADFDADLEFRVYRARDFTSLTFTGVSLFVYRVIPNGNHRTPAGRLRADGSRAQTRLPVDVHFLLTAWAPEASLQHAIVGWMMRAIEDSPILPSALLQAVSPGVFRPEETVELSLDELSTEDLLRLWDTLVQNVYQLSVPYVARAVYIESERSVEEAGPVQERGVRYRTFSNPSEIP